MSQPRFALHFILKLARTPPGIAGKESNLLRWRKRFADFHERIQRVPETQVRKYVGIGNKRIRIQKAEGRRLHRPAQIEGAALKSIGQIGDDHFSDVAAC